MDILKVFVVPLSDEQVDEVGFLRDRVSTAIEQFKTAESEVVKEALHSAIAAHKLDLEDFLTRVSAEHNEEFKFWNEAHSYESLSFKFTSKLSEDGRFIVLIKDSYLNPLTVLQ